MNTLELVKQLQKMVIWEVGNISQYDKGFATGVERAIEIILKNSDQQSSGTSDK